MLLRSLREIMMRFREFILQEELLSDISSQEPLKSCSPTETSPPSAPNPNSGPPPTTKACAAPTKEKTITGARVLFRDDDVINIEYIEGGFYTVHKDGTKFFTN